MRYSNLKEEAESLSDDNLLAEVDSFARATVRTTPGLALRWFYAVSDELERRTDPEGN